MAFDPWKHQSEVQADRDRTADNSGRFATVYAHADTVGAGELLIPDAALFGVRFVSKPGVAYGFEVDPTTPPVSGSFPHCDGFVAGWATDEMGFYVGAYLGLSPSGGLGYSLHHTFTFSGVALKSVPEYLIQ